MIPTDDIRAKFPQLNERVYGKPLVYLDNAATSLRPQSVIDKWVGMSSRKTANLHRAVHSVAVQATDEYEAARECIRAFINAGETGEIVFTSGATASLNLVASSFSRAFIREGDEVLVCEAEHHSDIVPWQLACAQTGAAVRHFAVDESGRIDLESLEKAITPRTRIVCVAQVSNVLGIVNPIRRIADICHARGVRLLVDGAQGIVHRKVDVRALGCDFYVFSGHKMYAAPGTGVLYGKRELLEQMPPFLGGGEMIASVKWDGSSYAPLPYKFEAGTQNISGTPCFVPAVEFMESAGDGECSAITARLLGELPSIDGLRLFGEASSPDEKIPLFSFAVEGAHHEDLALILDKMGIAVRSGQMCAEPLMDRYGVSGMLRASFAPYNTMQEAEYFVESLRKAIKMLK